MDENSYSDSTVTATAATEVVAAPAVIPESGTVVVLAYPGTEEKMKLVWERMCRDAGIVVMADPGGLAAALEEAMASDRISRKFVLTPANLVPTHPVSFAELTLPFVEERAGKSRQRWGCVPATFEKDILAEFLPAIEEDAGDERLIESYAKLSKALPYAVGHGFGNFLAKVTRGNPCEHLLIEALLTRHFIYASESGWPPVERLVDKTLEG